MHIQKQAGWTRGTSLFTITLRRMSEPDISRFPAVYKRCELMAKRERLHRLCGLVNLSVRSSTQLLG